MSMLPVIAIVGRSNVGKSTLFNRLTKTRAALVADEPGVTRDRQYRSAKLGDTTCLFVDTGGWMDHDEPVIGTLLCDQVAHAIEESDYVVCVVDGRQGLQSTDYTIVEALRKTGKPMLIVVNKIDHSEQEVNTHEFYALGCSVVHSVSAQQGRGVHALEAILEDYCTQHLSICAEEEVPEGIKVAVIGKPNVGKSTLINRLIGETRLVVDNRPGTTRDSIYIPLRYQEQDYVLIDTAGIRRRAKIHELVEKLSISRSMQSMRAADILIFIVDATDNLSDQDLRLLGLILEMGTPFIMAFNKWDAVSMEARQTVREFIDRRLTFVKFAPHYFIAAARGKGLKPLFSAIRAVYDSTRQNLSTAALTQVLTKATAEHEPPMIRGRRIHLRYAHLGGRYPMTILIHGKQTQSLPLPYIRYLIGRFRATFDLVGVPIHIKLKTDANPYVS